jgi:sarcosine oxidase subunit alpha
LTNATGHLAAINLAGPRARELLRPLCEPDLDLAESAFPYLGVRAGRVLGVPARLLRVGFVGELGYEIHLPSYSAGLIWDKLLEAGRAHQVRPFGVEAQRVLRLEKGHVIIGQDTDGLTHPLEAGLEWAVKMNKTFFVGQRSLAILARKPLQRRLIGFICPSTRDQGRIEECHLIIDQRQMIGRVTSVSNSPVLERVIGLAFIATERATPGTEFRIRLDDGRLIAATIAELPFYDPENQRQTQPETTT